MTVEKRTTIDPGDILAVEIECVKCRHRLYKPVGLWSNENRACPNCGYAWMQHQEFLKKLQDLVYQVGGLSESQLKESQSPFRIRLEIRGEQP